MLEEYYQLKIVDSCSEYLTKTYLILNLLMWVVCIKKDLHLSSFNKRSFSIILFSKFKNKFYIFKKLNLELCGKTHKICLRRRSCKKKFNSYRLEFMRIYLFQNPTKRIQLIFILLSSEYIGNI